MHPETAEKLTSVEYIYSRQAIASYVFADVV